MKVTALPGVTFTFHIFTFYSAPQFANPPATPLAVSHLRFTTARHHRRAPVRANSSTFATTCPQPHNPVHAHRAHPFRNLAAPRHPFAPIAQPSPPEWRKIEKGLGIFPKLQENLLPRINSRLYSAPSRRA